MRWTIAALLTAALPAYARAAAAAAEETAKTDLLSPNTGLMFWTLLIFVALWLILTKYAFKPITAAVEARERALQEAIDAATQDREAAARLLEEHRAQIESARAEAQRIIAEGRATGDKLRAQMLEETRQQQQEMLERARQEIGREKELAIAEMRAEAVDLALRAAEKVIEKNLDARSNRQIVEKFLESLPQGSASGR
jgi:F-type H+-transporting ATPase subunit b